MGKVKDYYYDEILRQQGVKEDKQSIRYSASTPEAYSTPAERRLTVPVTTKE